MWVSKKTQPCGGRWSGGCLIERRRQALRFPVLACRLPRYERVVANLGQLYFILFY
jgi:hypothetical protein